jgi:hypothetical protein
LGHGIFPNTPVENVQRVVDYVHERTTQASETAEMQEQSNDA